VTWKARAVSWARVFRLQIRKCRVDPMGGAMDGRMGHTSLPFIERISQYQNECSLVPQVPELLKVEGPRPWPTPAHPDSSPCIPSHHIAGQSTN